MNFFSLLFNYTFWELIISFNLISSDIDRKEYLCPGSGNWGFNLISSDRNLHEIDLKNREKGNTNNKFIFDNSFSSNGLSYDIIVRNWTSQYLQVKPFSLRNARNAEWIDFLYAIEPFGEQELWLYLDYPEQGVKAIDWLLSNEMFEMQDGFPCMNIENRYSTIHVDDDMKLPSQSFSFEVPRLVYDQPAMVNAIIFNFLDSEVFVSYRFWMRGKFLEFLPSGALFNAKKFFYEHNTNSMLVELARVKAIPVENAFQLYSPDKFYSFFIVNLTNDVLQIVIDSGEEELLFTYTRTESNKINVPPDPIAVNWEILDWQDGGAKRNVMRSGKQSIEFSNFNEIRENFSLYSINLVWDGDAFFTTYTIVENGSLIEIFPDKTLVPKILRTVPDSERINYHPQK